MALTKKQVTIVVALLGLAGVLGAAIIERSGSSGAEAHRQSVPNLQSNGTNNIQVVGFNNTINAQPAIRECRLKSHGVERYGRVFPDGESSGWMGGGHSQEEWCSNLSNKLVAQNPGAEVKVLLKSESKKNTCYIVNCPQYNYYCKVLVKADPIYFLKPDPACN
jgi:hypothetical protein